MNTNEPSLPICVPLNELRCLLKSESRLTGPGEGAVSPTETKEKQKRRKESMLDGDGWKEIGRRKPQEDSFHSFPSTADARESVELEPEHESVVWSS